MVHEIKELAQKVFKGNGSRLSWFKSEASLVKIVQTLDVNDIQAAEVINFIGFKGSRYRAIYQKILALRNQDFFKKKLDPISNKAPIKETQYEQLIKNMDQIEVKPSLKAIKLINSMNNAMVLEIKELAQKVFNGKNQRLSWGDSEESLIKIVKQLNHEDMTAMVVAEVIDFIGFNGTRYTPIYKKISLLKTGGKLN